MISGATNHLHIVMNDPVYCHEKRCEAVLLVNISTARPGRRFDDTCILYPSEHPFLKRQSYVSYSDAVVKSSEDLIQFVSIGEIIPKTEVNEEIFARVLRGLRVSKRVTPRIKRFVKQHLSREDI